MIVAARAPSTSMAASAGISPVYTVAVSSAVPPSLRTKPEIARYVRARVPAHLYDEAREAAGNTAIYTLSDPRDVVAVRYVGQTLAPRRRFLQHLGAARLWLPDETPWWIRSPKYRPLYTWIRNLYKDEARLPVMVVRVRVDERRARAAERSLISKCLIGRCALLNVEAETDGPQLSLL